MIIASALIEKFTQALKENWGYILSLAAQASSGQRRIKRKPPTQWLKSTDRNGSDTASRIAPVFFHGPLTSSAVICLMDPIRSIGNIAPAKARSKACRT